MTTVTGISCGFHDASWAYVNDFEIESAYHAERFTHIKNDKNLPSEYKPIGKTIFYEKPFWKNTRRLWGGQSWKPREHYDHYIWHHWSHAAAAYYTRPFKEEPVCVVIDAIGEWDTASIWYKKKKKWSLKYPKSLGLFYSAITKACLLKPMEEEYITMGMAAYGKPLHKLNPYKNYHKGIINSYPNEMDLAASAQEIIEIEICKIMKKAQYYSNYLCYGGGVALNCVANSKIHDMFKEVWIMSNPGDAGSALGSALAYKDKMYEYSPYLGTNITREINPKEVVKYLIDKSICGVANGRAEYGPRALGNRSLLADPRVHHIKQLVNDIKQREQFRPFAPAILEEWADKYFSGPMNEYMQYVAKAKHDLEAVTHVDGTARVQVVKENCKSVLRQILEEWYVKTGCPLLLNTSLNIKGLPMVNTVEDAEAFEQKYDVKVF